MTETGAGADPAKLPACAAVKRAPGWQRFFKLGIALSAAVLAGCSGANRSSPVASAANPHSSSLLGVEASPRVVDTADVGATRSGKSLPKGGGTRKIGKPYKVAGRWYTPREDNTYDRVGLASWYGHQFHGRRTANGEIYDMNALTAAHKTLPLPSYAYITNQANGRTVLVRINDRGPYAGTRIIDLSRAVARNLAMENAGVAKVRVQYAGPAPLDGNDYYEQKFLAAQSWAKPQSRPRRYASQTRQNSAMDAARGSSLPSSPNKWNPYSYRQSLGR